MAPPSHRTSQLFKRYAGMGGEGDDIRIQVVVGEALKPCDSEALKSFDALEPCYLSCLGHAPRLRTISQVINP